MKKKKLVQIGMALIAVGILAFTIHGCDPNAIVTVDPTTPVTPTPPPTYPVTNAGHVDNPYEGAKVYVNPEWQEKAEADGGCRIANQPTGVWLDTTGAIDGRANSVSTGRMGLSDHLDEALEQGGGRPIVAQIVVYNLPGRDCAALASNGELPPTEQGLNDYKTKYIDKIAGIMGNPKYASVRIVAIIEIDSLPNLVTNVGTNQNGVSMDVDGQCAHVKQNGYYVKGIQYALEKLHAIDNVYTYIDAGHHGWLGWDSNFGPTADLLRETVAGVNGLDRVSGFITNTANYSALEEPYLNDISSKFSDRMAINEGTWLDWNQYYDELSFASAFRQELISKGFSSKIGMLIDTSRNGWGGAGRPTGPSSSSDPKTYIDESRIDRRIHAGNWCNQSGAGMGERPQASPEPGIDAYVWIKPPGESDGASGYVPAGMDTETCMALGPSERPRENPDCKGFDGMCAPGNPGNPRNGNSESGALSNAPVSGAWFSAQFHELMENAYPPITETGTCGR